VGVSNDRRKGMRNLLDLEGSKRPSLYLWDDCYQHRWVKPSFLLLLTTYDKPYTRDFILPVGNLRELSEGAFRANAIVVTKCPKDLSVEDKVAFRERIQLKEKQRLFFSHIKYADFIVNKERQMSLSILDKISFLLVTGIADPTSLLDFLNGKFLNFDHIKFSDHHVFSDRDIDKIISKSNGRMVLTTQKDYMRLSTKFNSDLLFFMPIEMVIQDEREQEFLSFVEKGLGLH
jgi:tetraacyldisaccharide 4'-kinase